MSDIRHNDGMVLSDQLRKIIRDSGRSLNSLGLAAGIHRSTMGRFMSGERYLSPRAQDRLGEVLGLRLVVDGQATKSERR